MIRRLKRILGLAALLLITATLNTVAYAQNVAPSIHDGVAPASYTSQSFNSTPFTRDGDMYDNVDSLLADFYPSLAISYSKHSNARRIYEVPEEFESAEGTDDSIITVSPAITYRTDFGQHSASISYRGAWRKYDKFEQEDTSSHDLNGLARFRVGSKSQVDLFGGVGRVYEQRGSSGSRPYGEILGPSGFNPELDTGPDEVKLGFYGIEAVYGARGTSRMRVAAGVQRQDVGYANNNQGDRDSFDNDRSDFDGENQDAVNRPGNRDRVRTQYHVDAGYEITNSMSVFGRYEWSDIDFARAIASLDSEEMSYLIGLRWAPATTNISGQIGVGKVEKDFADPSRVDYDGDRYYGNLSFSPTQFLNFGIFASKYVEETGDQLSDYYVSEVLGLSANYSFTDRLNAYAFGKLISDEYELGRVDDFTDYGLGLNYGLYQWLSLGLQYTRTERESTLDRAAYTDNYYGITLFSDLRGLYQ